MNRKKFKFDEQWFKFLIIILFSILSNAYIISDLKLQLEKKDCFSCIGHDVLNLTERDCNLIDEFLRKEWSFKEEPTIDFDIFWTGNKCVYIKYGGCYE